MGSYSDTTIILLRSTIRKRLPIAMLTIPNSSRVPIRETNHIVLPVANMITNGQPNIDTTKIEGIEVEVECIHVAVAVVVDNDCTADSAVRLANSIRSDALEVRWVGGDIGLGGEVDIGATEVVQVVEVVEGERTGSVGDGRGVQVGLGVGELRADV